MDQPENVTVQLWPDHATAGALGTWVVEVIPNVDLGPRSYVRVQLPQSWHLGPRTTLTKSVHSIDPTARNYVSARCDQADVKLVWYVEGGTVEPVSIKVQPGIDGAHHRYNYVVRVLVAEGILQASMPIHVVFGDRTGGSPGFEAGTVVNGDEAVVVECVRVSSSSPDALRVGKPFETGEREDRLEVHATPRLRVVANAATKLVLTIPSTVVRGEGVIARPVFLDSFDNPTAAPAGIARTDVQWGDDPGGAFSLASIADSTDVVNVPASEAGTMRVRFTCGRTSVTSNPAEVVERSSAEHLFWGDMHSHAERSHDAIGWSPFGYARDVAHLDFYSLTEHSEGWQDNQPWLDILAENDKYDTPGHFVTIPGYECTLGSPFGHHNVYFRKEPLDWPLVSRDRGGTLEELWERCGQGDALTIPHHTGIVFTARTEFPDDLRSPAVDWQIHNEEFRRHAEIYSGHGQSELYDPGGPLSYERVPDMSSEAYSSPGQHYVRDGWMLGQQLGLVGSSDDHQGRPGRNPYGLVAVWATELSRDAIFDALYERRTYATTGERIILRFVVNDQPMGSSLKHDGHVQIRSLVVGTGPIESVSIIRADLNAGTYSVLRHFPAGEGVWRHDVECEDEEPPSRGFYYVTVMQRNVVKGRPVRAWSSPVWVGA